jgi:hypothetical protein
MWRAARWPSARPVGARRSPVPDAALVSDRLAPPDQRQHLGHHLKAPGFGEHLAKLLEAHPGIPAERLEIEILKPPPWRTWKRSPGSSATVHPRRELRPRRLRHRPFLPDLRSATARTDAQDRQILRAKHPGRSGGSGHRKGCGGLARSFGREVVAEGMETIEHGVALLSIGCEHAQGYGTPTPCLPRPYPPGSPNGNARLLGTHPAPPPEHGTQMPGGGT